MSLLLYSIQDISVDSTPSIPRITNNSNNDIVLDLKFNGTQEEMERIQRTIVHQFAPYSGFEVETNLLLNKRDRSTLEVEDNDSILDGQSQLSHITTEMRDEIETMIEEKLRKLTLFKDEPSFAKKSSPKRISCGNYNHGFVTCDNCGTYINGCARYKSIVKPDFDLCETCEATGIHPEPLIKIREPIGPRIGMKLNSHFDTLKNLFQPDAPPKQVVPTLCHIRRNVEVQQPSIQVAETTSKSTSKSNATETKMSTEEFPPKQKHTLCHIRSAVKEPVKTIVVEEKPVPMATEIINQPVQPQIESPFLPLLSRMFPTVNTKIIKEFLQNNEGLSLEEVANRFLDFNFSK